MMQKKKKKKHGHRDTEWPSAGGEAAVPEQGWMMDGSSLNGEWQACSQCLSEHLDGDWVGLAVGLLGSVTCMWGRGRPRAEGLVAGRPTLLLSSSRARVSCSNCTSCSLTDSSRAAALSHCSIHTTRAPEGKGWWWWGGEGSGLGEVEGGR